MSLYAICYECAMVSKSLNGPHLHWCSPDVMDEEKEKHQETSIHGHVIHNLTNRCLSTSDSQT